MSSAARAAVRACRVESLEGRTLWSATGVDLEPEIDPAVDSPAVTTTTATPRVLKTTPTDNATGVALDIAISAELVIPNGGVNAATLTTKTVTLRRLSDGYTIPVTLNTSGGGDVIVCKPRSPLEPNTIYRFTVTTGVKDVTGAAFAETSRVFTTGKASAESTLPGVKFEQIPLGKSSGRQYFGLAIGPDRKLYASTNDGLIVRWNLATDGTLADDGQVISTIRTKNGGPRFVIGMAFDPASTADNLILWVTHTATSSLDIGGAVGADWTGKLSRLTGPDLGAYADAIVNLPRSVRDHVTNQPVFGPDGKIYFSQPSNTAMGAPDVAWGKRPERLLTATILKYDPATFGDTPLDARTDGATPYDPFAAGAPLTIHATGVRNAYDLAWVDGKLYASANGSAAGGAAPEGPGVPGIPVVSEAETDYLFLIEEGKYYGHPNPLHNKFILNGGNPTAGEDPYEVIEYPVGTKPDPDWQKAIVDLGPHQSPVGMLTYKGGAFGGALNGKLLIARYSGGDDIVAVDPGSSTRPPKQYRLEGAGGIINPTDVVQNPTTGHLYVAELDNLKIRLLRPAASADPNPGPVENPIDPVDPVDPVTPLDPVDPVTPVDPVDPVDPDPVPIPIENRTSKNKAVMREIIRFAQKNSLPIPDTNIIPSAELKPTLAALKAEAKRLKQVGKVSALAAKKGFELPAGLNEMTFNQLKSLLVQIKAYRR